MHRTTHQLSIPPPIELRTPPPFSQEKQTGIQSYKNVSSDEEDTTLKVSTGVSAELKINPDRNTGCNTSPLGIIDLKPKQFVTTHEFPQKPNRSLKSNPDQPPILAMSH